jgi:hypothetical protein
MRLYNELRVTKRERSIHEERESATRTVPNPVLDALLEIIEA